MRRSSTSVDYLVRFVLWTAYRLLRVWWFIRRPRHDGAVIAIWLGGRILMVRHSYRNRLSWPGGGIKSAEQPVDAARRELGEELGLLVSRESLAFHSDAMERWEKRYDHVRIFELHLMVEPALHPDGREVVAARFMTPADALRQPLTPFVAGYLRKHLAGPEG